VQGRILAHQLFHRVNGVETAGPEMLVVPCVFADGDGEANAVEFDNLLLARGGEIALLVEDVVEGQEALVLLKQQMAAIEQDGCVDGWLADARFRRQGYAGEYGRGQLRGGCGQFFNGSSAAGEEAGLLKEIGWRVAADGQLGKYREPRAFGGRVFTGRDNLFKVSGEISDSRIDLGECDLHSYSLIPEYRMEVGSNGKVSNRRPTGGQGLVV
jgi:hypothetical protein